MSVKVGVLEIQGDVHENVQAVREAIDQLGVQGTVFRVKTPDEISSMDGLVIPGGESTTIGRLATSNGSLEAIKNKIQNGMPVLGICAGLILLSKAANDRIIGKTQQPLLEVLDVQMERNSFGRQNESFERDICLDPIGISKLRGVFIRAPSISSMASDIQVLSRIDEKIIAIKKEKIIGTAFHPELAGDVSLYKYFISMIQCED